MHRQGLIQKCYHFSGIPILTISNQKGCKSAMAISVNVGSVDEPQDCPGLSHLLQHLIFAGKRAQEGMKYFNFIEQHGGYENAETTNFYTNYFFQIRSQYFEEAVSKTLMGFANPEISEDNIKAEIEAIEQQYALSCTDQESRIEQINKIFMQIPLSRFTMGNRDSLMKIQIRDKLICFHKQYYLKRPFSIAIFSSLKEQQLQKIIVPHIKSFIEKIVIEESLKKEKEKQIQRLFHQKGYCIERLGQSITIQSISNSKELSLELIINITEYPAVQKLFQNSSNKLALLQQLNQLVFQLTQCIIYVIQHPSQASLSSHLEQYELYVDVQAKSSQVIPFVEHMISINLQPDEETNINKIYVRTIQYLSKFINLQTLVKISEEVRYLAGLNQRNFEIDDTEEFVCELARNMFEVNQENPIKFKKMDRNLLQEYKEIVNLIINDIIFSSNKILIIQQSNKVKIQKTEPYLGIGYSTKKLERPPKLKKLEPFNIKANPFLKLKQNFHYDSQQTFGLLKDNIYFKNSNIPICKGGVKLFIHNSEPSIINVLLANYLDLLLDEIENISFAESLGLQYWFSYDQGNLSMHLYGFDQLVQWALPKVGSTLYQFIQSVANSQASRTQLYCQNFEQAVEDTQTEFEEYFQEDTVELLQKMRQQIILENVLPLNQRKRQLSKIKRKSFFKTAANILSKSAFEWVVCGNFNLNQIQSLISDFQKLLLKPNSQPEKQLQKRVVKTKRGTFTKIQHIIENEQVRTSTCLVYFDGGFYGKKKFITLDLINLYLQHYFYEEMRNVRKLSYDFQINVSNTRGIIGITLMVVSSKADPQIVSQSIHQFIKKYTKKDFMQEKLKDSLTFIQLSLLSKRAQLLNNLQDSFYQFSNDVINRTVNLKNIEKPDQYQQQVQQITREQILSEVKELFWDPSCIEIFLVSKNHLEAYNQHRPKIIPTSDLKSEEKNEFYKDYLADLNFIFG